MKSVSIETRKIWNTCLIFTILLLAGSFVASAQAVPTTISVSGGVLQSGVSRLGVNLGDQDYWDSAER